MNAIELYNEGLMEARAERFEEAADLLRKAISKNPSHVNSYNVLGKVLIRTGAIKEARECWKTALTIDPLNRTAWACLRSLEKKSPGRFVRSLVFAALIASVFVLLVSTNWQVGGVRTELSELVALLHERLLSSEDSTKSVAPIPASEPERIASSEVPSGRTPIRAAVRTKPAPSRKGEVRTTYKAAMRDYGKRKFTRAMGAFRKVLNAPHSHALKDNAQYWIGECWYGKGEYERALTAFQNVSTLYPRGNKVLHARIKIAYCHYRLGEYAKARECLLRLQHKPLGDSDADRAIRRLLRRIASKSGKSSL